MILLDTDHFSALKYVDSERAERLRARMAALRDRHFAVTAITLDEQMRGWLAEIASALDPARQVGAYRRLEPVMHFLRMKAAQRHYGNYICTFGDT